MLKAFLAYGYIIISVLAFGQNDLVNLSDFNTEKLNELLVNYTNQLRVRKRKTALTYDPNLDAAAKNHAQYMAERNYLGHFQKNKSLKTVKDRVSILGGDADFVGENVQYVSLDYEIKKSKYRLTYSDLATILGDNWKNSKGHYANMIDDNYSGVSHQFVVKNGLLYVCQVFSSKPFEPVFEYQIGDGFHVKNKRACFNCKSTIKKYNKDRLHYGWYYISNDSLFYYNYKKINYSKTISIGRKSISLNFRKNNLKKIFNRKGKLSLDFVHMTQFDCNGNAAYDGALNYDGYFLGYIDKKSINEKNISNLNEVVQLYVGQIPKVKDENFQVDFFLTKKDRPCSQQRLVFIAPDYFEPREFFQLQHPEIKIGPEQIIRDSVSVKVPFLRNEIEADKKALAELKMVLRELKLDSSNVESASYTGIASIEGTKKINEQLIKKRASLIETLLSDYFPSIEMNYELIENFSDFRIAIQDKEGDKWLNASEEELRAYANKNKNKPKVAAMLDATRQSEVTIYTQEFYSTVELSPTVENLRQLIVENEYAAALLVWQQLTKIALQGDSLISSNLIELEIPKQKEWRKVIWEQFILDLKINETIVKFIL